ncbi:hypothetical protein PR202_gb00611 [Eleusine coracana subsp. coracana]|uniref:Uncharacterized protein n=1 Tax=Eleusine coracana subsp. coracana TaxID=191504 RepID=A0AAV5DU46_ELECO|nr:hypothetical protein PR202_gb00611 [Eleusine coracana subsp. coracana]
MSEEGDEENRLRSEAGVLERLVYKHRNQHRGAAYFHSITSSRAQVRRVLRAQVRRDLKLLLAAGLADVTNAVFPVLASRKPASQYDPTI